VVIGGKFNGVGDGVLITFLGFSSFLFAANWKSFEIKREFNLSTRT
jgi:hypothetical protein